MSGYNNHSKVNSILFSGFESINKLINLYFWDKETILSSLETYVIYSQGEIYHRPDKYSSISYIDHHSRILIFEKERLGPSLINLTKVSGV